MAWSGSYTNRVTQYAIGHGGFFSQSIDFLSYPPNNVQAKKPDLNFEMIYDCGSGRGRRPSSALLKAVDEYVDYLTSENKTKIDILVISHFDKDHVNGLKYLSNKLRSTHIEVIHVWAPLLDDFTKFSISLSVGLQSFVAMLVQNPTDVLSDLFPGSEINIMRPTDEPLPPPPRIPADNIADTASPSSVSPRTPSRGKGLVLVSQNQTAEEIWEIRPFVTNPTQLAATHMRSAIAAFLNKSVEDVTIDDIEVIRTSKPQIIKDFHDFLKSNMPKLSRSKGGATPSNYSSLCVYSGPSRPHSWNKNRIARTSPNGTFLANYSRHPGAPSWIGTGDAVLRNQNQVKDLEIALGPGRMAHVGSISVPHHGSKHDSSTNLWGSLPALDVATIEANHSIGSASGNKHPHQEVLNELTNHGISYVILHTKESHFTWRDQGYR